MKKFSKPVSKESRDGDERERRRATSERLPEPDQNPWCRAQFAQQDSSTEEEVLSSEEDVWGMQETVSAPIQGRIEPVTIRPVWRNRSLPVQEAVVRVETGLTRMLEFPLPIPSHCLDRPLIGGRRVPIENPVWDSFAGYRAEYREAVARHEEERQRIRETGTGDKENVEH